MVRGGQGPLRPVVVETKPAVAKPEQDDSPKVTPTPTPRKGKVKAEAPGLQDNPSGTDAQDSSHARYTRDEAP